ncbi:MAG: cytochrome c oxidase assembly protein [Actinomycetota bacterium]
MVLPGWHAHPDVWLLLGGIEAAYLVAVRRRARAHPAEDPGWRAGFFSLGMLALWIGSEWPIHDLAEGYLYSVHMVQHLLFSLVAPPLLLAGTPAWLLRRFLRPRPVEVVFRFLTRPLVALIAFNAVLLFTHWPAVVDASVGSEWAHFGLHVLLVASALAMWWPVLSPLPEAPPLAPPGQMLYLFLQSLAPTIPASFLTFGSTVLYPAYAAFPRIWGVSALSDQLVAGLIMKLAGGAILWVFIAAIFFRWHAQEERDGWDALQLRQVERDVRTELSKR